MIRSGAFLMLAMAFLSLGTGADPSRHVLSICELARHFPRYRNKTVTVRGISYYGLRQNDCPQKCASGLWPAFVQLNGGRATSQDALEQAHQKVEAEAKRTGKRFEIWITVTGTLETKARRWTFSPCDRKSWAGVGGYGHLGVYPAQIVVERITDIEVKENPRSLYDYANLYHGPL